MIKLESLILALADIHTSIISVFSSFVGIWVGPLQNFIASWKRRPNRSNEPLIIV
jgi:hypothetical protein